MTGSNLSAWAGVIDKNVNNNLELKTPTLFQNLHDGFDIRNGEMLNMLGNCGRKDPNQESFANFQS